MDESEYPTDQFYAPPRKRRVDRSVVRAVVKTRYYVYGRGYNSELEAYIQMAKREVSRECDAAMRKELQKFGPFESLSRREIDMRHDLIYGWDDRWYAKRYPMRDNCQCHFCWRCGKPSVVAGIPPGRGCWIAKMADYRKIARQIMSDIRNGFRTPDGAKLLALPAPSQCCPDYPDCDCSDQRMLAGQYASGTL